MDRKSATFKNPVYTRKTELAKGKFTTNFLLTLLSFALVFIIKIFPGKPVFDKIAGYKSEYISASIATSIETRMAGRFGLDYQISQHFVTTMQGVTPVLLLPPIGYIRKFTPRTKLHSLENPVYLYYMNKTVKAVQAGNPDQHLANCSVLFDAQGQCYPVSIKSSTDLNIVLQYFQKAFPYTPEKS